MKRILKQIPAPLLAWYQTHKRKLAWREQPTPYHVWVSEIMLQQTRVEAVKEYYDRFIKALPDVQALANCPEEELLKLWEGLGYYSRVRNMQKTAKEVVFQYGGVLPKEISLLKKLPGIGEYTAGAIASIAYGQRASAVDGNVLRVFARLTENATPINDVKYRKKLSQELTDAYPIEGKACSDFTQSLFELGALICKPKNPDCKRCPLQALCQANRFETQALYPVMPLKREKRIEEVFVFLLETPEGFAIRRRKSGVLKGMNEFPSHVIQAGESAESVLYDWGVYEVKEIKRQKFKHVFTHIRWNITCVYAKAESVPFDTYALEEIKESISLATAFKQCLRILEE